MCIHPPAWFSDSFSWYSLLLVYALAYGWCMMVLRDVRLLVVLWLAGFNFDGLRLVLFMFHIPSREKPRLELRRNSGVSRIQL